MFVMSAGVHFFLFQRNKRRGHFFIFSSMLFGFSLMRSGGLIMRIVWATNLTNVRVEIAANILAQAGSIIVFVVNLFLTQRVVRGAHPDFGWSTTARVIFRTLVVCVLACLIMLVAGTTQSFYTLDESIRAKDRAVQLFAGTLLTILAFLPVPTVLVAVAIPRRYRIEKFGEGSWRAKLLLLCFASTLLSLGAGFRVGVNFSPRLVADPAWYHGRTPFYVFNFVLDLVMSAAYIAFAFYRRFYVPDGAKGPGSYQASTYPVKNVGKKMWSPPNSLPATPVTAVSAMSAMSAATATSAVPASNDNRGRGAPAPTISSYRWPSSYDAASSIKKPKSALKRFSLNTKRSSGGDPYSGPFADAGSPVYYAKDLPLYRDFDAVALSPTSSNSTNSSSSTMDTAELEERDFARQVGGSTVDVVLETMLDTISQEDEEPPSHVWGRSSIWSRTVIGGGSRATTIVGAGSGTESEGEATNSEGENGGATKKKDGPRIKWAT